MKKRYDVKEIMKAAWEIRRSGGVTMSEAMKTAWSVAKVKVGASPMDKTIQAYFDAKRIYDKAKAELDAIEIQIQGKCLESPDFTISGYGWKASYKEVTSNRLDSKALKADYADLYKQYSKASTTRRFLCNPVAVSSL